MTDREGRATSPRRNPRPSTVPAPGPRLEPVLAAQSVTCKQCGRRFVSDRYEAALRVCTNCGHHGVVSAPVRIQQLGDPGSIEFVTFDDLGERDPLQFDDGVPYPERLIAARKKTGLPETFAVARASMGARPVVIAAMDFGFMGGSLGSAAGECFARACDIAVAEGRAVVAVCTSGGARMQEGIASLAQMARCSDGVNSLAGAGLPYVTILADPCFGGVTASFAVQGDAVLAEPRARVGFAGGRVIEQATHDKLPDGFQTAEFLVEHGMIDAVVARGDLRDTVARLVRAFMTHRGYDA